MIADFDVTEEMLRHFIQKVHQNRWAHPRVVVCVPSGVTGVEKRAVEEACLSAGARQAYLIEEPMAAAIGAGLPVGEPTGNMVVDIGGGTSEVAVISLGGIVVSQSIRVGGDELDEAIINYVKKEYKLLIGQQTAEEVKLEIGSAYPLEEEVQAEIRGRDLVSGLPKTVVLTSEEVRAALEEPLVQIIDAIKETLDRTPPELASDIMDRGIMLAGGGSLLQGLDERLRDETQMPAHRAESPLTCVAVGSGRSLEEFEAIHRSNRNSPEQPAAASLGCRRRAARRRRLPAVASLSAAAFPRSELSRMYDKQVRRRRAVLFALVACCLVLLTAYFGESSGGPLKSVQSGAMEVLAPVQEGANRALKPFRDLFGWFGDTLDAKDERDALREGARPAAPEVARAPGAPSTRTTSCAACSSTSAAARPRRLRAGDRARLRRSNSTWYSTIEINKGSSDGVAGRPARHQRQRPGRQGQDGLRRQRRRDAAHRRRLRRLGARRAGRPAGHRSCRSPARRGDLLLDLVPAGQGGPRGRPHRHRRHDLRAPALAVPARTS